MSKAATAVSADFAELFGMKAQREGALVSPPPMLVAYVERDEEYELYTISSMAVKLLSAKKIGFKFQSKQKVFKAITNALPKVAKIRFYKFEIITPTKTDIKRIQELYTRYLRHVSVIQEMEAKKDQIHEQLQKELHIHGLKIKPGCPEDSQLFMTKQQARIHNRQSLYRSFDEDVILKSKNPEVKACVETKQVVEVNYEKLEKVLPKLPAELVAKIQTYESVLSFTSTPIMKAECEYCGGRLAKNKTCKRCGVAVKV